MFRYLATVAVAGLLITIALKSRDSTAAPLHVEGEKTTIVEARPDVKVVDVPGGRELTIQHRFAGAVSRARLVYEQDGDRKTVDQTNCQRSLDGSLSSGSYTTEVRLSGRIPSDVAQVQVVLEDETGTRILPVSLN